MFHGFLKLLGGFIECAETIRMLVLDLDMVDQSLGFKTGHNGFFDQVIVSLWSQRLSLEIINTLT